MSVLDVFDATRLCARWTAAPAEAWSRPVPVLDRPEPAAPTAFSLWSMLRNPHAMAVTGMVGTLMVKDAALRRLR